MRTERHYKELFRKDDYRVDNIPTAGSENAVSSGGTYTKLEEIREVAHGATKTWVTSVNAAVTVANYQNYRKYNGGTFASQQELTDYINGYSNHNAYFNQPAEILKMFNNDSDTGMCYFIVQDNTVERAFNDVPYYIIRSTDLISEVFKVNDNINVIEEDVPDRWVGVSTEVAHEQEMLWLYPLESARTATVIVESESTQTLTDSNSTVVPVLTSVQVNNIYQYIGQGKVVYVKSGLYNYMLIRQRNAVGSSLVLYATYCDNLELVYTSSGGTVAISFVDLKGYKISAVTETADSINVTLEVV